MNILFYISNISLGGGTERASITIANELAYNTDNRIYIVTAYGEPDRTVFTIDKNVVVVYLNTKGRPLTNLFSINKGISKAIGDYSIDTVVSNEVMSIYFTLPAVKLYSKKIKFIVWEHFNFNATLGKKGREIARKISARYADYVVTLTGKDKKLWETKLSPKAKIVTITNPAPFFNKENPYSSDSKIIIAIGHLNPVKGFDLLIHIWSILRKKYPDISGWQQYIIGNGSEKDKLENMIADEGLTDFIRLVPATREIEQYYSKAAFIVMTSHTEGLPMTLIEAQQFGLPAISFYHPEVMYGPGEIIEEGTGFLVNQYELETFADKMHDLMSDNTLRFNCSINSFNKSDRSHVDAVIQDWNKII
jgi:glycosyltransferase involved in cell wall biosynthesis